MRAHIFAASYYIEANDDEMYRTYLESLKFGNCLDNHDELVNGLSLDMIKKMYAKGDLNRILKDSSYFVRPFVLSNKFEFLISISHDNGYLNNGHAAIDSCSWGSYKILDRIFDYSKPDLGDIHVEKCANASPNKETLEWVYNRFKELPNGKRIQQFCTEGRHDIIEYLYSVQPNLLNNKEFVYEAFINNHIALVTWFINNIPRIIGPEEIPKIGKHPKVFHVIKMILKP